MIDWKFIPKGNGSIFDSYEATHGRKQISITSLSYLKHTNYALQLWDDRKLIINKHFDAKDWDEAKATAISMLKDYLARQAAYWRDLKIGFANWVEED